MKYIQGNLIEFFKQGEVELIGHQANCFSVMGAGIAGAINREWNILEIEKSIDKIPVKKFNTNLYVSVDEGIIVNMYSQFNPGRCIIGIDSFNIRLMALQECLYDIAMAFPNKKMGFPLVASGIAADQQLKGNMTDLEYFKKYIEPIFSEVFFTQDVTIVYL